MGNMSYCRFQNTLSDLQDCYDSMQDRDELSSEEKRAKDSLIELCAGIVSEYGKGLDYEKIGYNDNTMPADEFDACCGFEDACEEVGIDVEEFKQVEKNLKTMGYEGVELYETMAKMVEAPALKQYVENGTITNREDLKATLSVTKTSAQQWKTL